MTYSGTNFPGGAVRLDEDNTAAYNGKEFVQTLMTATSSRVI